MMNRKLIGGAGEIERHRRYEDAVWLLSDIAQASAVTAMEHLQAPDPNFKVMVEDATRSNCADGLVAGSDLKIVMCLTAYCRTSQLKAALPINLACSWGLRDKVIWVLADMNDEDESSTLLVRLAQSVAASLVSGQLYVVRRAEAWSGWHACFAKITSHIAGTSINNHFTIFWCGFAFIGIYKTCTHIGQVCTHLQGRCNIATCTYASG